MNTADEIAKLAALRDAGELSTVEFEAEKAKLLGAPAPGQAPSPSTSGTPGAGTPSAAAEKISPTDHRHSGRWAYWVGGSLLLVGLLAGVVELVAFGVKTATKSAGVTTTQAAPLTSVRLQAFCSADLKFSKDLVRYLQSGSAAIPTGMMHDDSVVAIDAARYGAPFESEINTMANEMIAGNDPAAETTLTKTLNQCTAMLGAG